MASAAPLRMERAGWPSQRRKIHAAHARLGGERDKLRVRLGDFAGAQVELLLGQHHDAAAFRGFVGERGELRGVGQAFGLDVRRGQERRGHAVAERDGAGLVEQQHVHVAGGLDRRARSSPGRCAGARGPCPLMPMALSNPPMVVGIKHTSSAMRTGTENTAAE